MKIIFLDIDGVLNCPTSRSRCGQYTGIDNDKVILLRGLVSQTQAKIVLISTWKYGWYKSPADKYKQDGCANYLDKKFKAWLIEIFDKTADTAEGFYLSRGEGILEYLNRSKATDYVILDDCQFDYDGCGLTANFVKTDGQTGLTPANISTALQILTGQ